jgi:hypothetical protein
MAPVVQADDFFPELTIIHIATHAGTRKEETHLASKEGLNWNFLFAARLWPFDKGSK